MAKTSPFPMVLWSVVMAVLSCVGAANGAPVRYTLTWLGDLPGGDVASSANGINEAGQVVGWSSGASGWQAVIWEDAVMAPLAPDFVSSSALDINDAGVVTGGGPGRYGFLWDRLGGVVTLPPIPNDFGGSSSAAGRAINNRNEVAGFGGGRAGPGEEDFRNGAIWDSGAWNELSALPYSRGRHSFPNDINDFGVVVGGSRTDTSGDTLDRAVVWENGEIRDLGALPDGDDESRASAINNSGQIVGVSDPGFLGYGRATLWEDDTIIELSGLPTFQVSGPIAINNAGQTVGTSVLRGARTARARVDGSSVEVLIDSGLTDPTGIAVDTVGGKVYWVDTATRKIQRADLDGSNVEDVVTAGVRYPKRIEIDAAAGKMYWLDEYTGLVQRADLNGENVEEVLHASGPHSDIALDTVAGKIYWSEGYSAASFNRANLDGSSIEKLFNTPAVSGIALDSANGKVYWVFWASSPLPKIRRANLDGSQVEDLVDVAREASAANHSC